MNSVLLECVSSFGLVGGMGAIVFKISVCGRDATRTSVGLFTPEKRVSNKSGEENVARHAWKPAKTHETCREEASCEQLIAGDEDRCGRKGEAIGEEGGQDGGKV